MAVTLEFKPHFIHYGCLCGVGSIERLFSPLVFARPPVLHCVTVSLTCSNPRLNLKLLTYAYRIKVKEYNL